MQIEHIAMWTNKLEVLKSFYEMYFQAQSSSKYVNPKTLFESYFLRFPSGSARLELMTKSGVFSTVDDVALLRGGLAHFAFAVGSKEAVDSLITRLVTDGFTVVGQPRITGDGYYECCVLDPDGNRIEITV